MESSFGRAEFVGVIPAAGTASRLNPSHYAKELLPVTYQGEGTDDVLPVPVITLSLGALREAAVCRCIVATSDRKPELMRYLGDGSEFGLQLSYVLQPMPSGLSSAIDLVYPWVRGCHVCLLLPDTIVRPTSAMSTLRFVMEMEQPDLVLGVFPTSVPERLGPVRFNHDCRVTEVLDKPMVSDVYNTWAMAIWSTAFADLLHGAVSNASTGGKPLGEIFNLAVQVGMNVRAVWFASGSFIDIGTSEGIVQMIKASWGTPDKEATCRIS